MQAVFNKIIEGEVCRQERQVLYEYVWRILRQYETYIYSYALQSHGFTSVNLNLKLSSALNKRE